MKSRDKLYRIKFAGVGGGIGVILDLTRLVFFDTPHYATYTTYGALAGFTLGLAYDSITSLRMRKNLKEQPNSNPR